MEPHSSDPVIDLIARRHEAASRPGRRADGAKLGLVIEGGGMRGVVGGGMVTALDGLGLRPVFDGVYGASAGACTGAYFVAGQAALGTRIFYQDINNTRFIALGRLGLGRPVMNLGFLIDDVMALRKPLDGAAVCRSDVALHIVATDADRASAVVLAGFAGPGELMEALRASACLPLLAGPPVSLRGRRLMDGGVVQPVPLDAALDDGCTHLLVLRSRPSGRLSGRPGIKDRWLFAPLIARRIDPTLARAYLARPALYAGLDRRLDALATGKDDGPAAHAIRLSAGTRQVGRLETDGRVLLEAARAGAMAVFRDLAAGGFAIEKAGEETALCRLDPPSDAAQ